MNRVGYFSTAGGGDGAPVESQNRLVLGNITSGQAGPSSTGLSYSSAGIGGSFQPPSNTYNGSHFYTTAVTDFPNTPGIPAINQHESSRDAKYITIVPGGSPLLTVTSPIASAPTSVQPQPQHIGPMTSVRSTDTLTHSRLPHLSSLEVQYVGGSNQSTLHTVSSETKFFNSMPDLFTYMDQPGDQQEIEVTDDVYIDMNQPSNFNRGSMLSNESAMDEFGNDPNVVLEVVNITGVERQRTEERKQKLAEAARLRYQKLSAEEKKEVNARRTAALQRKRQRQREIQELENLLRNSNDIQEDPVVNEQLKEKRIKARRAEAARLRYQRMTPEERKAYNYRRRLRQLGLDEKSQKEGINPEVVRQHIMSQNARKAEAARLRYHRMTPEEKKVYNRRRTASFKRRKMEEELLLSTPAGQISTDALQKAQQIMVRNAKRAEMARLRYQRMTPEQRREYNARRARAKKERSSSISSSTTTQRYMDETVIGHGYQLQPPPSEPKTTVVDEDALTLLEKEITKRTKQAQAALMKQRQRQQVLESTTQRAPSVQNVQVVEHVQPQHHHPVPQRTPVTRNKRPTRQVQHPPPHQPAMMAIEQVQVEDPNAQRSQLFYNHEGELVEFKQEDNQPTIYIQDPQNSIEESIRQIVLQANQLPIGQQPQHILVEIPAEASGTGTAIQTIYTIRASATNPNEIHIEAQPSQIAVSQFSPNQSVGVVLSQHSRQDNDHIGKQQQPPQQIYQQQFYSAEDGSIVVEDSGQQPTTSGQQQQQVIYQTAASYKSSESGLEMMTPEQKLEAQRAKRAARARERYRRMSEDDRKKFNAKRAMALRKARSRDDELCRMAEVAAETGEQLDDGTIKAIQEAQMRRAKRAESARLKYQRMTSEERRQYNAMRDAQRRQRKREQEEGGKQQPQQTPQSSHMATHFIVEQRQPESQQRLVSSQQIPAQDEQTIMYSAYDMDQQWAS